MAFDLLCYSSLFESQQPERLSNLLRVTFWHLRRLRGPRPATEP